MSNELLNHRLPILDREYRYSPSKNPYWTKLYQFKDLVFSDNDTEVHAGQWRKQFRMAGSTDAKQELHVEIGCNAGHVVVEWAHSHPQKAYIGIDWKFKSIFRAAEKVQNRDLKNILFFRSHAERLPYMFGSQEIDFLYLFFPDPWPRKSQWKNRFIQTESLKAISQVMKPNGVFHIKTDHRGYFEWMLDAVAKSGDQWEVVEENWDLHKDNPTPHLLQIPNVTLFEKLFIKDKLPIHSLKLRAK